MTIFTEISALAARPRGHTAFILLITVGTLLAAAVLLSKLAAEQGAPMLWYLTAAMSGSGVVLFATSRGAAAAPDRAPTLTYSLVAGGLLALGSALGYLSVERVGASFVALAMAFPTMMTYLLSLALGMDRFDRGRLAGVGAGLAGGLILALGKGIGAAPADVPALVMVCLMPAVLAIGNIYRTRFWPRGAMPRLLAGQMLLCGGGACPAGRHLAARAAQPFAARRPGPACHDPRRDPFLLAAICRLLSSAADRGARLSQPDRLGRGAPRCARCDCRARRAYASGFRRGGGPDRDRHRHFPVQFQPPCMRRARMNTPTLSESAFPVFRRWPAVHPDRLQIFGAPTPNGVKVSIMLEETGLSYEAHRVDIMAGDQHTEEFLSLNPNGKIPAIVDPHGPEGKPFALWESGAILIYLAEKTGRFLPREPEKRFETLQWLMFQMGGIGPIFGQVGWFHKFGGRDIADKRPLDRYVRESRRLLDVLDARLADRQWIVGGDYTIADMATLGWVENLIGFYEAAELVDFASLRHVPDWLRRGLARPAVQRGLVVAAA
jgi:GST-like protein